MRELISATTISAHSAAARVASTLAPMVQKPCSSAHYGDASKPTRGRKVQQANVHVVVAVAEKGGHFAEENGHLRISAAISQDT